MDYRQIMEEDLITCSHEDERQEPHRCPFRSEILDDKDKCTCCRECECQCNDEI